MRLRKSLVLAPLGEYMHAILWSSLILGPFHVAALTGAGAEMAKGKQRAKWKDEFERQLDATEAAVLQTWLLIFGCMLGPL
jgi:hypothetical protein